MNNSGNPFLYVHVDLHGSLPYTFVQSTSQFHFNQIKPGLDTLHSLSVFNPQQQPGSQMFSHRLFCHSCLAARCRAAGTTQNSTGQSLPWESGVVFQGT